MFCHESLKINLAGKNFLCVLKDLIFYFFNLLQPRKCHDCFLLHQGYDRRLQRQERHQRISRARRLRCQEGILLFYQQCLSAKNSEDDMMGESHVLQHLTPQVVCTMDLRGGPTRSLCRAAVEAFLLFLTHRGPGSNLRLCELKRNVENIYWFLWTIVG